MTPISLELKLCSRGFVLAGNNMGDYVQAYKNEEGFCPYIILVWCTRRVENSELVYSESLVTSTKV